MFPTAQQYYKLTVSKRKKGQGRQEESDTITFDVTKDVVDTVSLTEEDGKTARVTFTLKRGFTYLNVLATGMNVTLVAGTINENYEVFVGSILVIKPKLQKGRETQVEVVATDNLWKSGSILVKDFFYPQMNHPKSWAQKDSIKASEIMKNIAQDAGYQIGKIDITRDITYTAKKQCRQHKKTDWAFIRQLASDTHSVAWLQLDNGKERFYCKDETALVNTLADITLYMVTPDNVGFTVDKMSTSGQAIQMLSCDITLDPKDGKESALASYTDPETGEEHVAITDPEKGDGLWIFDESKLQAESAETRDNLFSLYLSGELGWEEVKVYFKQVTDEQPSRKPVPDTITVEKSGDTLNVQGTQTTNSTLAGTSQSANERYTFREEVLQSESPEVRSEIFGKTARGELSDAEFAKYFEKEAPQATADEDEDTHGSAASFTQRDGKGFKIDVSVVGDLRFKTKKSYVLEGLGKYSDKYYLYSLTHTWGTNAFHTKLKFVQ